MGEHVKDYVGIVADCEGGVVVYRPIACQGAPAWVDHGPIVSQQDYLAGQMEAAIGEGAYAAWMAGHPTLGPWWAGLDATARHGHWLAQAAQ